MEPFKIPKGLTDRQRDLLVMSLRGYSFEDMAQQFGVTKGRINWEWTILRRKLKSLVKP